MTLPRIEVEFTLAMAKQNCSVMMPAHVALALCERWLAVEEAPPAVMDTRDVLGICAPTEEDFPAIYAIQGRRVRLVVEE